MHYHANEDEVFVITEGAITFKVNDGPEVDYPVGTVLNQPRGTKHTFYAKQRSRFLAALSPSGLEDLFRAIGTKADVPYNTYPDEPVPPTPEQLQAFMELAPKYGIVIEQP